MDLNIDCREAPKNVYNSMSYLILFVNLIKRIQ